MRDYMPILNRRRDRKELAYSIFAEVIKYFAIFGAVVLVYGAIAIWIVAS